MPDALLFTSTLVMGWIFPVATTDRATSPRVTFANRLGSIEEPLTSRASATPAIATIRTTPTLSQTQNRLLFRDAANTTSPARSKPEPSLRSSNDAIRYTTLAARAHAFVAAYYASRRRPVPNASIYERRGNLNPVFRVSFP